MTMPVTRRRRGRVLIEDSDEKLRLAFPVRAAPFNLFGLTIMLVIWAYAEVSAISAFMTGHVPDGTRFMFNGVDSRSSNDPDFMAKWLMGWTAMGLFFAGMFLFAVAGKEVIELDATWLKRRKLILGLGHGREYKVASIAELRPTPTPVMAPYLWNFPLNFNIGTICFDYGRDTHLLGAGLKESERRYIIEEMCRRMKSLCQAVQRPSPKDAP